MPRFEHDGISHYYTVTGMGFPLILIHGMGLSHQMWIGQTPLFARHYTVIAYDTRGNGGTGVSKGPITVRHYSEDLHALYQALGIEKAVLVGYSTGTLIAEQFAIDHPEKVAGLCLIGSFAKVKGVYMSLKVLFSRWLMLTNFHKLAAYAVAVANAENLVQRGFFYRIAKRSNIEESLRMLDACEHFLTTREVSQRVTAPVLLVHGSKDRSTATYAREFAQYLPHVRLSVVEGCNHAVATRAQKTFNHLLSEWLNELPL
ncbi:alpha/beta fold hydrolase [Tumebacillus permanentifrigoris]|uniref:Pimeloyl-ACP methyl ester carboxylesterase n=1 Tax=Tumebacillus permanentifrigoris TaxID=378543 RepID=A0A316D7A9_9BACL|nr:alpha/beta hydrolase [Tumebacillus permanentifrigoris]PWK11610.1 pimeloyl-ACP methyl ester carboxylesterase [Tumebacillus permanentifrigoris]